MFYTYNSNAILAVSAFDTRCEPVQYPAICASPEYILTNGGIREITSIAAQGYCLLWGVIFGLLMFFKIRHRRVEKIVADSSSDSAAENYNMHRASVIDQRFSVRASTLLRHTLPRNETQWGELEKEPLTKEERLDEGEEEEEEEEEQN